jgi:hypothetical protein
MSTSDKHCSPKSPEGCKNNKNRIKTYSIYNYQALTVLKRPVNLVILTMPSNGKTMLAEWLTIITVIILEEDNRHLKSCREHLLKGKAQYS